MLITAGRVHGDGDELRKLQAKSRRDGMQYVRYIVTGTVPEAKPYSARTLLTELRVISEQQAACAESAPIYIDDSNRIEYHTGCVSNVILRLLGRGTDTVWDTPVPATMQTMRLLRGVLAEAYRRDSTQINAAICFYSGPQCFAVVTRKSIHFVPPKFRSQVCQNIEDFFAAMPRPLVHLEDNACHAFLDYTAQQFIASRPGEYVYASYLDRFQRNNNQRYNVLDAIGDYYAVPQSTILEGKRMIHVNARNWSPLDWVTMILATNCDHLAPMVNGISTTANPLPLHPRMLTTYTASSTLSIYNP